MRGNFSKCLDFVLKAEGGYVNDPNDNGGATNMGVTQATYNAWRESQGLARRDVKQLARTEAEAIYRNRYWSMVHGDDLPRGIDLAMLDFAVHSGVKRAVMTAQKALGLEVDGILGPKTIRALCDAKPATINSARLAFMQSLDDWKHFNKGWASRIVAVQKIADLMGQNPNG